MNKKIMYVLLGVFSAPTIQIFSGESHSRVDAVEVLQQNKGSVLKVLIHHAHSTSGGTPMFVSPTAPDADIALMNAANGASCGSGARRSAHTRSGSDHHPITPSPSECGSYRRSDYGSCKSALSVAATPHAFDAVTRVVPPVLAGAPKVLEDGRNAAAVAPYPYPLEEALSTVPESGRSSRSSNASSMSGDGRLVADGGIIDAAILAKNAMHRSGDGDNVLSN